jgi:nucleoid DNA-binding protein
LVARKLVEYRLRKELSMESKPKNLGRAYLMDKLRERGLSRRDSARIVNFVLKEMAEALKRGESVEFPLGTLRRVRHQRTKQRGWFLGKITTIYKRPYTVKHELDEEGYKLLNGKK